VACSLFKISLNVVFKIPSLSAISRCDILSTRERRTASGSQIPDNVYQNLATTS
jgi:hypothetical protein